MITASNSINGDYLPLWLYGGENNELIHTLCIPIDDLIEAALSLPYGSHERVMFIMQICTGCRIKELEKMRVDGLYGNKYFWRLGKNQRTCRNVQLPNWFIDELRAYRNNPNNKFYATNLFGFKSETYKRRINKFMREKLKPIWREQALAYTNIKGWSLCYKYQLNGIRKTWATHRFYYWHKKSHYNYHVALDRVCKDMQHSSNKITYLHYISDRNAEFMQKYEDFEMWEILEKYNQKKLNDY